MTTTSVEELQAELAAVRLERDRVRSLLRAAAADLDAAGRNFLASNYRRQAGDDHWQEESGESVRLRIALVDAADDLEEFGHPAMAKHYRKLANTRLGAEQEREALENLGCYPIAVIEDRYSGSYAGGRWIAVANAGSGDGKKSVLLDQVLDGAHGCEDDAEEFWEKNKANPLIAVGDTPSAAVRHLVARFHAES